MLFRSIDEIITEIEKYGVKPALSLKPGTPVECLYPYLDRLYMVLVMTVEPGFGGQKFMADQMEKLQQYVKIDAIGISGGLTNNRNINQLQADVYQKRIYHLKNSESTASGAWMVAAAGLGWYTSVQDAFDASGLMETAQFYNPGLLKCDLLQCVP